MIDALVTGRSLPALMAALDLAEVGLRVAVAADERELAPPFAPVPDHDGVVRETMRRVAAPLDGTHAEPAEGAMPRAFDPVVPMLVDRAGAWAPQPQPAVLGIPASPLASEVIRLVGTGAALRAYRDRVTPVLTVGKTRSLGALVRGRVGNAIVTRLVEPQVRERFGVGADAVDVAVALPGLNEALSRVGSLTGAALAYSERNVARETRVAPADGITELVAVLLQKLELYGVTLLDETVEASARASDEGWNVTLGNGTTLQSRALVLDAGREARQGALVRTLAPALAPALHRVHAVTVIDPVEGLAPGSAAVRYLGDAGQNTQGGWSLRLEWPSDGLPTALLSGDAADVGEAAGAMPDDEALDRVLASASVRRANDAVWESGAAAAPFTTASQRGAADHLLAEATGVDLLPVGAALHGDDLAAALRQAHDDTVLLRRHLAGITE